MKDHRDTPLQKIRNFIVTLLVGIWNLFYGLLFLTGCIGGLWLVVSIFIYPAVLASRYGDIDGGAAFGLSMIAWVILMLIMWKTGLFKLLDIVQTRGPKILLGIHARVEKYLEGLKRSDR